MIRKRLWLARGDNGATLLLVLILMSVTSIVLSVVLAQADTGVRSTIQLRDQASNDYSADGAMQAVLNSLKTSGLTCNTPTAAASATLGSTASPFYAPDSSEQGPINAYAECTPDGISGLSTTTATATSVRTVSPPPVTSTAPAFGGSDPTLPQYGMLATGTGSGDYGIDLSNSAGGTTFCVQNGSVWSNKDVNASGSNQTLAVRLDPAKVGQGSLTDCTTGTGTDATYGKLVIKAVGSCLTTGHFKPTDCTSNSGQAPVPDPPTLPAVNTSPADPVCFTKNNVTYAAFSPGLYTDVSKLNSPCASPGQTVYEWMRPGVYYFNYGNASWDWPSGKGAANGWLIAGTPTDISGNTISGLPLTGAISDSSKLALLAGAGTDSTSANYPSACASPTKTNNVQGAELIFAGASYATASDKGVAELCASSPTTTPPVALYGLHSTDSSASSVAVPVSGGGSTTLPVESLCSSTSCGSNSIVATSNKGQAEIYFKGFVYVPDGQMKLYLKNTNGQVFNWGVVVRDFWLFTNGVSPNQPFLSLPDPSTAINAQVTTSTPAPYPSTSYSTSTTVKYSIRYINVWTCTVAYLQKNSLTTCPKTGPPSAQAKVLTDVNGVPVKILSWTHVA